MQGMRDLASSERGVFCLLVLAIITAFVLARVVDGAAWIELVKFLSLTLVASKTLTSINDRRVAALVPGATP